MRFLGTAQDSRSGCSNSNPVRLPSLGKARTCYSSNLLPRFIDDVAGTIAFVVNTIVRPAPNVTWNGQLDDIYLRAIGVGTNLISIADVILLDSRLEDVLSRDAFPIRNRLCNRRPRVMSRAAFVMFD